MCEKIHAIYYDLVHFNTKQSLLDSNLHILNSPKHPKEDKSEYTKYMNPQFIAKCFIPKYTL